MLLGVPYYANIHHIGYFIAVQVFGGAMQVLTHNTYTNGPTKHFIFAMPTDNYEVACVRILDITTLDVCVLV